MATNASRATGRPVQAALHYIVDTGVKPTTFVSSRNSGKSTSRENGNDVRTMQIFDGRPVAGNKSLDRKGSELCCLQSTVVDYDDEQERMVHYARIENLILDPD